MGLDGISQTAPPSVTCATTDACSGSPLRGAVLWRNQSPTETKGHMKCGNGCSGQGLSPSVYGHSPEQTAEQEAESESRSLWLRLRRRENAMNNIECAWCKRTLPRECYTPTVVKNFANGWTKVQCKTCHRARQKGISFEEMRRMYAAQDSKCGSCKTSFPMETLHIDHDHRCCPRYRPSDGKRTNKACGACVRGLLCKKCNRALGVVELQFSNELSYFLATLQTQAQEGN